MIDHKTILSLLEVAVPPATPLTVASEIKILELLGIISNPELIRGMQITSVLVPTTTQASLKGLAALLGILIKTHQASKKEDHDKLDALLKSLDNTQDAPLTFGTFLPICAVILQASHATRRKHTGKTA